MLPECRAFLEYYRGVLYEGTIQPWFLHKGRRGSTREKRGVLYEGTMAEWWASFCVEEAVGHWARFFGGALRKAYKMPEEKIVYFRVHAEADLEEHADGVMAHADL